MGFADSYFEKQKEFQVKIEGEPNADLKYIVVIPCYYEFEILSTLNSIWDSERPRAPIDVIVVINSAENSDNQIIDQNKKTYAEVKSWIENHEDSLLRFFVILEENLPEKFAGAGLARKIGMDQAIFRFNKINSDGLIISIDADSEIKSNYFTEIEKHLDQFPKTNAITTYFEHPIAGNEFKQEIYDAVSIYELYLRYYKIATKYTGFPYSYYTIGSCFAVTAKAYMKQGGMNKKQAGEDFYFLHKIFPLGQCFEINSACVYPSPRPSNRVPFGTGPMVESIANSNEEFLSYDLRAFSDLKKFFQIIDQLYKLPTNELAEILYQLPLPIVDFLSNHDIHSALEEINDNSSSLKTFKKRFFDWFNAFRILKYLNATSEKFYPKTILIDEAEKLLKMIKKDFSTAKTYSDYLEMFRGLEREF
ncbi:MAG TPA: family 2 glycosyl transferase [Bacteroidales bacterium]|nr:family 2 glycosyl transferase [Bacteroidales bacterium]